MTEDRKKRVDDFVERATREIETATTRAELSRAIAAVIAEAAREISKS